MSRAEYLEQLLAELHRWHGEHPSVKRALQRRIDKLSALLAAERGGQP